MNKEGLLYKIKHNQVTGIYYRFISILLKFSLIKLITQFGQQQKSRDSGIEGMGKYDKMGFEKRLFYKYD